MPPGRSSARAEPGAAPGSHGSATTPARLSRAIAAEAFVTERDQDAGYLHAVISSATAAPASTRLTSASWWFRSRDGRLTVWQVPNPALTVWLATLVLGMLDLSGAHRTEIDGIRHGALLVWALDEVLRGASPFRRVLGAVVLTAQLASLVLG
jgi:hypothetical protein